MTITVSVNFQATDSGLVKGLASTEKALKAVTTQEQAGATAAVQSAAAQKKLEKSLQAVNQKKQAGAVVARQSTAVQKRLEKALQTLNIKVQAGAAAAQQSAAAQKKLEKALTDLGNKSGNAARELKHTGEQIEQTGRKSNKVADGGLKKLAYRWLTFTAALGVGRQLLQAVNTLGALDNRLRLVAGNDEALKRLKVELFGVAQASRASYESVAELYARIGTSAKQLNISQADLLKSTDLITKAVTLSGATATEASAGLIQFAQGLASGTLRGDELRSVLEQLPGLADAIGLGLGKLDGRAAYSRGEIRKLAEAGELTGQRVLNAVLAANDKIEADYATFVPTVAQGWAVLSNGALKYISDSNAVASASGGLATALEAVGKNFDLLANATVALAGNFLLIHRNALIAKIGLGSIGASALTAAGSVKLLTAAMRTFWPFLVITGALAGWDLLQEHLDSLPPKLDEVIKKYGEWGKSVKSVTEAQREQAKLDLAQITSALTAAEQRLAALKEQGTLLSPGNSAEKEINSLRKQQDLLYAAISNTSTTSDTAGDQPSGTTSQSAEIKALQELQAEAARDRISLIQDSTERAVALAEAEYQKRLENIHNLNAAEKLSKEERLLINEALAIRNAKIDQAKAAAASKRGKEQLLLARRQASALARVDSDLAKAIDNLAESKEQRKIRGAWREYHGQVEAIQALELSQVESNNRLEKAAEVLQGSLASYRTEALAQDEKERQQEQTKIQDNLARSLETYKKSEEDKLAFDFDLRERRAALTESPVDDLAVARDRDLAEVDAAEGEGIRTPEELAELRAIIWAEYYSELEKVQAKTQTVGLQLANFLVSPITSSAAAVKSLGGAFDEAFKKLGANKGNIKGIADQFSSVAIAALEAGDSVGEAVEKMLKAILRRLAIALLEFAAISAIDAIASALGAPPGLIIKAYYGQIGGGAKPQSGGVGATRSGDAGDGLRGSSFHTGGIVGSGEGGSRVISPSVFAGAPRLHSGGLAGGEVPAILQSGEGVFTPAQMRALAPAAATDSRQPLTITVEIVNQGSADLEIDETETQSQVINDNYVISVIAKDIKNNGRTGRAISSSFAAKRKVY